MAIRAIPSTVRGQLKQFGQRKWRSSSHVEFHVGRVLTKLMRRIKPTRVGKPPKKQARPPAWKRQTNPRAHTEHFAPRSSRTSDLAQSVGALGSSSTRATACRRRCPSSRERRPGTTWLRRASPAGGFQRGRSRGGVSELK